MVYEKQIVYIKRTGIKLWNLYNDNIIAYFKKRFSSYLIEMGLSWLPYSHPRSIILVKNQQKTEAQFHIFLFDDEHNKKDKIEERFLNMDLNHLLFFDIADKDKEFNVLNQFNEKLKITNPSFFFNPSFYLILYDSTNEKGHFQPPEICSIFLPSYSDLIITKQKHFVVQGFYEWLYKTTNRTSMVIKAIINPEEVKFYKNRQKKIPAYEMDITITKIVRYEYDILLNRNKKSHLSQILERFSMDELKKIRRKLKLTEIPTTKNQLVNHLVELSAQINIRDSIVRMCKEILQYDV